MDEYGTENIQTKYNGNSYSNWIENQFNNGTLYINYRDIMVLVALIQMQ